MVRLASILAVSGMAALSAPQVSADCVNTTSSPSHQEDAGIAKDGSHAPMESQTSAQSQPGPAEGTTTASSDTAAEAPQKDGANMPMGENPDIAASSQDVQAQQKGGKTAAAAATNQKC
jgi:hypothetical protein